MNKGGPADCNEINTGNYSIFIGRGALNSLAAALKDHRFADRELFFLVDENSAEFCLPRIYDACSGLTRLNNASVIQIPSGETQKNLDTVAFICSQLNKHHADKRSVMINAGGGVISDIGGFAASVYKRGIDFINIPTTLLAQVDASVGGKVGVDLDGLKNMVGVFNEPEAVFIDTGFLTTLNKREMSAGFAEMVKHALIADAGHWKEIRKADPAAYPGKADWTALIARSVGIKHGIVAEDPYEKGPRKALNFGHTVGHAIETHFLKRNGDTPSAFGRQSQALRLTKSASEALGEGTPLLHGEAVAFGMIAELYLSQKVTGLPPGDFTEAVEFLRYIYGVPWLPGSFHDYLIGYMKNDKKNRGGKINFTLLDKIGSAKINCEAGEGLIRESLEYLCDRA